MDQSSFQLPLVTICHYLSLYVTVRLVLGFKLLPVLMPTKATIGVHQQHVLGGTSMVATCRDPATPDQRQNQNGPPTVEQRTSSVRPNLGMKLRKHDVTICDT